MNMNPQNPSGSSNGRGPEPTNRGLPDRLTIPMRGHGELWLQSAQPVEIVVTAYRVGDFFVFGTVVGSRYRVVSDRYCPDAIIFWQRITRTYVGQRVHVYRSKSFEF